MYDILSIKSLAKRSSSYHSWPVEAEPGSGVTHVAVPAVFGHPPLQKIWAQPDPQLPVSVSEPPRWKSEGTQSRFSNLHYQSMIWRGFVNKSAREGISSIPIRGWWSTLNAERFFEQGPAGIFKKLRVLCRTCESYWRSCGPPSFVVVP